jgi:Tfp pilus assembly protein PilO
MKDIFRSFNDTERKRLQQLLLILGVSLVFLFLVSLRERRSFHRLEDTLAGQKAAFVKLDAERSSAVSERAKWEQAVKDLDTLKADRFYQDKDDVNVLRLDLQQLFAKSGITARAIKFDYTDMDKERSRKVTVTFNFTGSYPLLKDFLDTVEQFPKFICLERLDFVRITGGGNNLELRVVLAGYYANF